MFRTGFEGFGRVCQDEGNAARAELSMSRELIHSSSK